MAHRQGEGEDGIVFCPLSTHFQTVLSLFFVNRDLEIAISKSYIIKQCELQRGLPDSYENKGSISFYVGKSQVAPERRTV